MSGKCPADRVLVRLFMDECGPRERDRVLRHLASCSRCALRFDVLRQIKRDLGPKVDAFADQVGAAEAGPLLRRASRESLDLARRRPAPAVPRLRLAAAFLGALAVVSAAAFIALNVTARRSELRSPSPELKLLSPVGRVSAPPSVFRWTPVLDAESYVFELTDDALKPVHRSGVFLVNELVLPPEVKSRLVPGRPYLWTVIAEYGDSNRLASRSASFVIE